MDLFSLSGVIIILLIALFLGRVLTFVWRNIFYILIFVLVAVFIFGVSLNDILDWIQGLLIWAL